MALTEGEKANLETIIRAAKNGGLALIEGIEVATGERRAHIAKSYSLESLGIPGVRHIATIRKDAKMVKSWKPEVFVEGKWSSNGLRFATEQEAKENARDLLMRWFVPTDSRAAPSEDPVNYKYVDGQLIAVETE